MRSLGYYPTTFSRTAVARDVTLFFPTSAALVSRFSKIFHKHEINESDLLRDGYATIRRAPDGGIQLALDLYDNRAPAVYLVYHAVDVPGMNGGYEAQYDLMRAIVEVDTGNRIIVHPYHRPKGSTIGRLREAKQEYKYQLSNVERFIKTVFSEKFMANFSGELPLPCFFP